MRGPLRRASALAALTLIGIIGLRLARRSFDVVEVRGRSMVPTLLPGDRLLVARTAAPRAGQIVLAPDPRDARRELIKRVARIEADGVELRGDDPTASTDARTFGRVPVGSIRWRAVLRYWPPRRLASFRVPRR